MGPSLCSFLISKEHLGFNIWFWDIPFFLPFSRHLTPFSSGLGGWEGKNEGRANSQNLTAFVWVIAASLRWAGHPYILMPGIQKQALTDDDIRTSPNQPITQRPVGTWGCPSLLNTPTSWTQRISHSYLLPSPYWPLSAGVLGTQLMLGKRARQRRASEVTYWNRPSQCSPQILSNPFLVFLCDIPPPPYFWVPLLSTATPTFL